MLTLVRGTNALIEVGVWLFYTALLVIGVCTAIDLGMDTFDKVQNRRRGYITATRPISAATRTA